MHPGIDAGARHDEMINVRGRDDAVVIQVDQLFKARNQPIPHDGTSGGEGNGEQ